MEIDSDNGTNFHLLWCSCNDHMLVNLVLYGGISLSNVFCWLYLIASDYCVQILIHEQ